ncbi:hypothetical protein LTSEADE_2084, partial [Salmonella enterica subsp. enterica serovar Adelaide str. A4-669]
MLLAFYSGKDYSELKLLTLRAVAWREAGRII